jgi:hypothetical protein
MRHELCADRVNALTRDPQSGQRSVGGRSWRDAAIRDQRNLVAGLPLVGSSARVAASAGTPAEGGHEVRAPRRRSAAIFHCVHLAQKI